MNRRPGDKNQFVVLSHSLFQHLLLIFFRALLLPSCCFSLFIERQLSIFHNVNVLHFNAAATEGEKSFNSLLSPLPLSLFLSLILIPSLSSSLSFSFPHSSSSPISPSVSLSILIFPSLFFSLTLSPSLPLSLSFLTNLGWNEIACFETFSRFCFCFFQLPFL